MIMAAMIPIIILKDGFFAKINITTNWAMDNVVLRTLIPLYNILLLLISDAPKIKLQKNHMKTFTNIRIATIK